MLRIAIPAWLIILIAYIVLYAVPVDTRKALWHELVRWFNVFFVVASIMLVLGFVQFSL
jgi:hypothetical protein